MSRVDRKIRLREPPSFPETRRRFSRAVALWVYFPVGIGALAALALAIGIAAGGSGGRMQAWSHLATVLLAGLLLEAGLAALAFLILAAIGIGMLVDFLPRYSVRLRRYTARAARAARITSDSVAEPFIFLAELRAAGGGILELLGESIAPGARKKGDTDGQSSR